MAFGDPNWVSLLPGPPAGNAQDAANKGALAGYQLGQMAATRGALQHLDINDPTSTNNAVGALVRAGALDQASSLMNLNFTRDLRSRVGPLFDRIGQLGSQPPAASGSSAAPAAPTAPLGDDATMTPDHQQHVADTMSQGVAALQAIRALPPEQRQGAFAQARQAFVDRGIPEAAIDAVGRDLSDNGLDQQITFLSAHGDHFGAAAQGNPSTPPTMAHPTGYGWASDLMNDPNLQLGIAMAKAAGIDLSGLTDTARALVMPQIDAQAKAAYAQQQAQGTTAGTNLANTDPNTAPAPFPGAVRSPTGGFVAAPGALPGQAAAAASTALGTNAGSHGGEVATRADGTPVVIPVQGAASTAARYEGATAGAKTAAETSAAAPGHVINLPTPDGGQVSGTWVNGPNGWHFQEVQGGPSATPGIGHAPTPQQAAVNKASADQLVADRASSGRLQTDLVPLRTAYDLVRTGGVTLGPGSEAFNRARSFVLSTLGPGVVSPSQVANYDEVHKYLVQIANQRASQFGAGTNEKLAVAASGSPNVDMSNLGASTVLRMNIALARAEAAKVAAYNGPPEGYSAYAAGYGRTVDPRAFMLDMMSKGERQRMLATITSPSEKRAFLSGVQAAKAAGYFSEADLPR